MSLGYLLNLSFENLKNHILILLLILENSLCLLYNNETQNLNLHLVNLIGLIRYRHGLKYQDLDHHLQPLFFHLFQFLHKILVHNLPDTEKVQFYTAVQFFQFICKL